MGGLGAAADLLGWVRALMAEPSVGFGVQLAVGVIFVTAGLHKLRRPGPSAEAIGNFGLPRLANRPVARLLGTVEVAVGAAVVVAPTAQVGAGSAVVLGAVFTGLTARAVRRGERFACGCLSASSDPIDKLTVARAAALLVAAGFVATAPSSTTTPAPPAVLVAAAVAAALVGLPLAVVTWRRCRRLTSRYVVRVNWDALTVNWANQPGAGGGR